MPETNRSSPDFLKSLNSFAREKHDTFWLATRFLEKEARIKALCVLCLDGEFFRVVSTVNEEIVAQIRLQWWRDEMDKLLNGEPEQLTLPAQALAHLLSKDAGLKSALLDLINAYDDVASGQPGRYAESLFALLFLVNGASSADANRFSLLSGPVFQSANSGGLNTEAVRALVDSLTTVPDAVWPFLSLFEFTRDWRRKRKSGAVERRWRMLASFLGGEGRLQKKLLQLCD